MSKSPRMLHDHKVAFLREDTIARVAFKKRRAAKSQNIGYFRITDYILNEVSKVSKTGPVTVEFFNAKEGDPPAYVTFKPTTVLHCDREIWSDAELGDPDARFILAHEVGHIVLHDSHAQAFLEDQTLRIKFGQNEDSAEWQANKFAMYFLAPLNIINSIKDAQTVAQICGIRSEIAREAVECYNSLVRKSRFYYSGDHCSECSNFTTIEEGTELFCCTCGATTTRK